MSHMEELNSYPMGMFSTIAQAQMLFLPIIKYILAKIYKNSDLYFVECICGNRIP